MSRAKITKSRVDGMKPGGFLADNEIKGFVARRLRSGVATYGYRYRDKITGRQRWIGLGLHGPITAEEARDLAKKRAGEVADSRAIPLPNSQSQGTKPRLPAPIPLTQCSTTS